MTLGIKKASPMTLSPLSLGLIPISRPAPPMMVMEEAHTVFNLTHFPINTMWEPASLSKMESIIIWPLMVATPSA